MPDDLDDRKRRVKLEHATRGTYLYKLALIIAEIYKKYNTRFLEIETFCDEMEERTHQSTERQSWTCSLVKTYHYDKGIQRWAKGRDAGYNATVHRRVGYQHCGAFQ